MHNINTTRHLHQENSIPFLAGQTRHPPCSCSQKLRERAVAKALLSAAAELQSGCHCPAGWSMSIQSVGMPISLEPLTDDTSCFGCTLQLLQLNGKPIKQCTGVQQAINGQTVSCHESSPCASQDSDIHMPPPADIANVVRECAEHCQT